MQLRLLFVFEYNTGQIYRYKNLERKYEQTHTSTLTKIRTIC